MGTNAGENYIRSDVNPIRNMFDNWIGWGIDVAHLHSNRRYLNFMCFVSRPTAIKRGLSELMGIGRVPSSNIIKTLVEFDRPFRVALCDIPSNFRANDEETRKFIDITNESCQRVYERNFIRRKE